MKRAVLRQTFRRLAWTLGLLAAIYLVVGNIFINTPLGPRLINRRPERFHIDWRGGLTWWPGQVAVWDVALGGQARRTAWTAHARRARGRIAIWHLVRRELHMPSVWANEVVAEITRAKRPLPARGPGRSGGWTLRFDRIASDSLRHVRWADLRLTGTGACELAFVKRLRGGPMEIRPSRVNMRQARLQIRHLEIASQARVDLDLALARHTREQARGWRKLALAEARLTVDGAAPALAVAFDDDGRWHVQTDAERPSGRIQGRLTLANGVLQPGGNLEVRLPLHSASPTGAAWDSQAELQATVDEGLELRLRVPAPPDGVGRIDADLRLATTRLPLAGDWRALAGELSGTMGLEWQFDSLSWLTPIVAKVPWLTLEGAGEVAAALRIERGQLAAGSRLTVPDVTVSATVLDNRISGSARADARIDQGPEGPLTRTEIVIERFLMAPGDDPASVYVDGTDLHLDLVGSGRLADLRDSLHAALRFEDARVADLRAYNRYLPEHVLRFLGGSGRLSGDLELDAAGQVGSGRIQVIGRDAQLALGDLTLSGDLELDGRLAHASVADQAFRLDGTRINLTNVRAADPEHSVSDGWWARVALDRASVRWGRPLEIEGRADATLQNVGPLLALFTRHRDYPRWALRVVDAGQTRVTAQALLQGQELVLDRIEAANERFDLEARLRLTAGPPAGDLYLRWGPLGLGLELLEGRRDFHFVRPARWYRSRPNLLPAAGGR